MRRMETPRLAMRLPAHVLNGLAVALGISLIVITLTLAAGKLAALAAATGAICASLADLPIAPQRTWRRVGMGALVGWASGVLIALLSESGVAMGFIIIGLSFCSTMALSWGLRAGPLSFIPILALIFTLAAPPHGTRAMLIHAAWSAVGGGAAILARRAPTRSRGTMPAPQWIAWSLPASPCVCPRTCSTAWPWRWASP